MTDAVTDEDVQAAALQYVRKIAGMRSPSAANAEAFRTAVASVATSTQALLDSLVLRPVPPRPAEPATLQSVDPAPRASRSRPAR